PRGLLAVANRGNLLETHRCVDAGQTSDIDGLGQHGGGSTMRPRSSRADPDCQTLVAQPCRVDKDVVTATWPFSERGHHDHFTREVDLGRRGNWRAVRPQGRPRPAPRSY